MIGYMSLNLIIPLHYLIMYVMIVRRALFIGILFYDFTSMTIITKINYKLSRNTLDNRYNSSKFS